MAKVDRDPVPVKREGRWEVDLRAWGFGWHYVLGPCEGPGALTDMQAGIAGMRRLMELERADDPGDKSFADVVKQWHAQRDYGETSKRYGEVYAKAVAAELGEHRLRDLEGGAGSDLLRAYRDDLKTRYAPATVSNRLNIVGQVIDWCAEDRHWLQLPPRIPARPPKRAPIYTWIDEESFRALRARVFTSAMSRAMLSRHLLEGESLDVRVAKRRLYLSWLFYTGVHTADADKLTASHLALDFNLYTRHNSKSAACVPDEQFEMPLPLIADLRDYLAIVGREFFLRGERFGGGKWTKVAHVVGEAARELGIAAYDDNDVDAPTEVTPRVFRRSYAREMFCHGYTVLEVADRMGHVDTKMLREVYMRAPRPQGRAKSRWGMVQAAAGGAAPAHAGMRVIPFPSRTTQAEQPSRGQDARNIPLQALVIRPGSETEPGNDSAEGETAS